MESEPLRIGHRTLVVLVGPAGAGKSTWARRWFAAEQVVSSDDLRAVVGESATDQRAGADAFAVLDRIVAARLRRGLPTVVDATGLEDERRVQYVTLAADHGFRPVAVAFDVSAAECKRRNATRAAPVPARVIDRQVHRFRQVRERLEDEGFLVANSVQPVEVVPEAFVEALALRGAQKEEPMPMRFGLSIPRFDWTEPERLGVDLAEVARTAEQVGFDSIWVMDHVIQIPSFGPAWDPMLEGYTTATWIAAATERLRVGLLVGGVLYRNPALVGKIVATLDVLSGGRAWCGLGIGWFEREHRAYGWPFPPPGERYSVLEDALRLLPLLWGPGTPPFEGETIKLEEAICYPRPVQDPHPPILVGGVGEKRTLKLVAQYAQACNLPGDADLVRRKVDVLRRHCDTVGRDPREILVTQLGDCLLGTDREDLADRVERLRPHDRAATKVAADLNAGTVDDQIGRFRALADAGVQQAIVSFPDLDGPAAVERFAPVIEAYARS